MSSKDAMIKDLKAKLDALETAAALAEREGLAPSAALQQTSAVGAGAAAAGLGSPGGVPFTDVSNMPAAELRTR